MRSFLSLSCALASYALVAQSDVNVLERSTNTLGQTITVVRPSSFTRTRPVRTLAALPEVERQSGERKEVVHARPMPEVTHPAFENEPDGAVQTVPATRQLRLPLVQFGGQNGSGIPPDPTGAAGPDHYVQAVNTSYRVYSKTGAPMSSTFSLATLWPGSDALGDPIVMYDRHADRWFISQFNASPNRMLLAVSATPDPEGEYYAYSYTFSQFPDYPKFSIWWDGYYMTSNSNKTAVVFERDLMLAGDPDARMVALSAQGIINSGFTSVLPADADGDLPPAGTPCYFFNIEDNSWGAPSDRIRIYEMSTDWNTTSNTTVTASQSLNTATFDPWLGTGWNNIPQPGTTQKLDAGLGIFYYRAQHMRWPGYNSVVLCHGVDVGGNHCAIRWYELRDANDGNWSIFQQGTWNPDGADRFYGSIAMDNSGNIGLGYSTADDANSVYAGLRYTGRLAGDPLGEMTLAEQTVINGAGAQEGTNRFGDYAHLSLDPDGQTFWCTAEYLNANGDPRTRIYSFAMVGTDNVEDGLAGTSGFSMDALMNGNALIVRVSGAPEAQARSVEVIGADGKVAVSRNATGNGGTYVMNIDVSALAQGVWFVRAISGGEQRVQRVVKTN